MSLVIDKLSCFIKMTFPEFQKKLIEKLFSNKIEPSSYTSKLNIFLLKKLFEKVELIRNPPNSPDPAYPIKRIWGIIKPRVKRRDTKSLDELKKYLLEESNSIPLTIVRNLCKEYLDKLRKCFEIGRTRIESEYFYKRGSMSNK